MKTAGKEKELKNEVSVPWWPRLKPYIYNNIVIKI